MFEDFIITSIEQVADNVRNRFKTLVKSEMFWIYRLNSVHLYGLNDSLENIYYPSPHRYFNNHKLFLSIHYFYYIPLTYIAHTGLLCIHIEINTAHFKTGH